MEPAVPRIVVERGGLMVDAALDSAELAPLGRVNETETVGFHIRDRISVGQARTGADGFSSGIEDGRRGRRYLRRRMDTRQTGLGTVRLACVVDDQRRATGRGGAPTAIGPAPATSPTPRSRAAQGRPKAKGKVQVETS